MICNSRFCNKSVQQFSGLLRVNPPELIALFSYLESLVLQDSLDGGVLPTGGHLGLEDHTERAIAYNLALGVGNFLGLAGQAVVDLFVDNLCGEGRVS